MMRKKVYSDILPHLGRHPASPCLDALVLARCETPEDRRRITRAVRLSHEFVRLDNVGSGSNYIGSPPHLEPLFSPHHSIRKSDHQLSRLMIELGV